MRPDEKKELALARSIYWKWNGGGGKGGKKNDNGALWEKLKDARSGKGRKENYGCNR
jgi:hypothetical protein